MTDPRAAFIAASHNEAERAGKDARATTGFHIMTKPVGPICNLDCQYCFYLQKEKLYPEKAGSAPLVHW